MKLFAFHLSPKGGAGAGLNDASKWAGYSVTVNTIVNWGSGGQNNLPKQQEISNYERLLAQKNAGYNVLEPQYYASKDGLGFNLLQSQGVLPSWYSMNKNYPKNSIGGEMYGPDVYQMVGGAVYNYYQKYGNENACALRISYALNKSGSYIPSVSGTFQGADGNNYFLSASKLNNWMTNYYGAPNISLKTNFQSQLQGYKGIYIMTPNFPGRFGASGHATLFDGTNCIGNHCYFDATGGVYQTNLWILK